MVSSQLHEAGHVHSKVLWDSLYMDYIMSGSCCSCAWWWPLRNIPISLSFGVGSIFTLTQVTIISQYTISQYTQFCRSLHAHVSVSARDIPGNIFEVRGNTGISVLKF